MLQGRSHLGRPRADRRGLLVGVRCEDAVAEAGPAPAPALAEGKVPMRSILPAVIVGLARSRMLDEAGVAAVVVLQHGAGVRQLQALVRLDTLQASAG